MEDDILKFEYKFSLKSKDVNYRVDIDRKTLSLIIKEEMKKQKWMELDFKKCSICPLDSKSHPYCPLALATAEIITEFKDNLSYDKAKVTVKTRERIYYKDCDLQKGLSALLGLLMATSGCPFFYELKPVARFHLPFATIEETIFRVASSYLLGEYFSSRKNPDYSFEGLTEMYGKIEKINEEFLERLYEATNTDSSLNAVVTLDIFAKKLPISIKSELEEIRYIFDFRRLHGFMGEKTFGKKIKTID